MKRTVAKGAMWSVGALLVKHLFSIAVVATLTRLLGPDAFGSIAIVVSLGFFISIFIDLGGSTAIVQIKQLSDHHLQTAFSCMMLVALASASLLFISAHALSQYFVASAELTGLFKAYGVILLVQAYSIPHQALLLKNLHYRDLALRTAASNIGGGLFALFLAFGGYNVWALFGQQLASSLIGVLILQYRSGFRPRFSISPNALRELLQIGAPVAASSLAWFVSSRLDQLAIGKYLGSSTLGLYSVGGKLPEMLNSLIGQPLQGVLNPAFARMQGDHARMRDALYYSTKLNAFIAFPAFVGAASIASTLVPVLFGEQWSGASTLCSLICLQRLVVSLQVCHYPVLLATRSMGAFTAVSYSQALLVLAICYFGVRSGIHTFVLLLLLNSTLFGLIVLFFLRHRIGLQVAKFLGTLWPSFACASGMAATIQLTKYGFALGEPGIFNTLVQVTTGAFVYFALAYTFFRSLLTDIVRVTLPDKIRSRLALTP